MLVRNQLSILCEWKPFKYLIIICLETNARCQVDIIHTGIISYLIVDQSAPDETAAAFQELALRENTSQLKNSKAD